MQRVVLVIAAGEGGGAPSPRLPSSAPRGTPLQAQLDALRREVRAAAGR